MKGAVLLAFILLFCLAFPGWSQGHPEVLVVYNSTQPDSLTVATDYATARHIPAGNLCAISASSTDQILYNEYINTIAPAIKACITATQTANSSNVIYIVMSYLTPYSVYVPGTFSLDSFVADIWNKYASQPFNTNTGPTAVHGYYTDAQSEGGVYKPFASFAAWRALPRSYAIYSVWRLDGASKALAEGLFQQAIIVENSGGLTPASGVACFDLYYGNPYSVNGPLYDLWDTNIYSGDWDVERASEFVQGAGFTVLKDPGTGFEPGGGQQCQSGGANSALYAGWYSLNGYPTNTFFWVPGAIGFHLDSESALNPRGGSNWAANAIIGGITVTAGSVNEPFLQGLPRPGGVYHNLLEGANVGDAFLRNTRWLKWMMLFLGDPLYTPFPNHAAPPALTSLYVSPVEIVGGLRGTTATLTLSSPTPTSLNVPLSTSISALSMPASVTVPANSSSVTFNIGSSVVTTYQQHSNQGMFGTILANAGSYGQIVNTVTVDPMLACFPDLFSSKCFGVFLSQSSVIGGSPVTGTVFLNDRAPVGGVAVSLSSSNQTVAGVPATVTVPAGRNTANFTITTAPPGSSTPVSISASYAGATPDANVLTVN